MQSNAIIKFIKLISLHQRKEHSVCDNFYLWAATFCSTVSATCQSSNKFGYSAGSARESAALGLTCKGTDEQNKPRNN
jgi:hypothetical protein